MEKRKAARAAFVVAFIQAAHSLFTCMKESVCDKIDIYSFIQIVSLQITVSFVYLFAVSISR